VKKGCRKKNRTNIVKCEAAAAQARRFGHFLNPNDVYGSLRKIYGIPKARSTTPVYEGDPEPVGKGQFMEFHNGHRDKYIYLIMSLNRS
jgi:hypothetical protein